MEVFWTIFLFLLGATIGSFLNVVVYRMPRGESIVFPGSHCPRCGRPIKWYDNIPLLSWLLLKGKCRFCKAAISPRYPAIEFVTAVLVAGLYLCFFVLHVRQHAGRFPASWPMFASHAVLLCGLLACTVVDIEHWIVPLEICWFVSLVGVVAAAAAPHPLMPKISPAAGAMSVAAVIGLLISIVLMRYGFLQQSFLDADYKEPFADKGKPKSVAITSEHGVNPRREVLREVIFLAPAIILAVAAYFLLVYVRPVSDAWAHLTDWCVGGRLADHVNGLLAALFGYLIGGAWIWGMRIIGTLGFGKEAMGLGDVHILAAVGAVTGWIIPTFTFFIAPILGLIWAVYLLVSRKQRELPYGPWLAAGALLVILFYDELAKFTEPIWTVFR